MRGKIQLSMLLACVCALATAAQAQEEQEEQRVVIEDQLRDEAEILAILESDADWMVKQGAVRALRQVGTVRSVPVLQALLQDEQLANIARYALEPMPFEEAGQALRNALGETSGTLQAGVVSALGKRQDAQAVQLIAPLLASDDSVVAVAAAGALGRIATPGAIQALLAQDAAESERVRVAIADGLLAAGHANLDQGNQRQAASVFQEILAGDWPEYVHLGAFRGLAHAYPNRAPAQVLEALRNEDPLMREFAAQIVAETEGANATRQYARALADLPSESQVALLRGLGLRRDATAHEAIVAATGAQDRTVRVAALHALGNLGTAADVQTLTALLTDEDEVIAEAAAKSLASLRGEEADAAIARAAQRARPEVRAQLLDLLTLRMSPQALRLATEYVRDGSEQVRLSALRTIAHLGGPDEATLLAEALQRIEDAGERTAATQALAAIASHHRDNALPAILQAKEAAPPETQMLLLRALPQVGSSAALEAVVDDLDHENTEVSAEAVRVLSSWPTQEAMPHLLELARSEDAAQRDQGLRGYVRLARETPAEQRAELLRQAMELAETPAAKRLVFPAWGTLPTQEALDTLTPHLEDPEVRNEAAAAIIQVAAQMARNEETRPQGVAALNTVLEHIEHAGIRGQAERALENIQ